MPDDPDPADLAATRALIEAEGASALVIDDRSSGSSRGSRPDWPSTSPPGRPVAKPLDAVAD